MPLLLLQVEKGQRPQLLCQQRVIEGDRGVPGCCLLEKAQLVFGGLQPFFRATNGRPNLSPAEKLVSIVIVPIGRWC